MTAEARSESRIVPLLEKSERKVEAQRYDKDVGQSRPEGDLGGDVWQMEMIGCSGRKR